jgi:methylmalonyl-CoA mutase C-terminal domain/subunit
VQETFRKKLRILIGKPGLDGHSRGAKLIARVLRDAGMEVIYTGIRQTPEQISKAAIQEDVDMIGISILSGAHLVLVKDVINQLKKEDVDIPMIVGGIIPKQDIAKLEKLGVKRVFGPGTSTDEVVNFVKDFFPENR